MQPYRLAVESGDLETRAELTYDLDDPRRLTPAQKAFNIAVAGLAATIGTAIAGFPLVATATLAATSGLTVWRWRRANEATTYRFTIDRGALEVARGKTVIVRTRLAELVDVLLDTKTIQKVISGNQPTPAITHTGISPEIDQSRLTFVMTDREPFYLTEAYLAHYVALEWLGKTRTFLRDNGWVPDDERG